MALEPQAAAAILVALKERREKARMERDARRQGRRAQRAAFAARLSAGLARRGSVVGSPRVVPPPDGVKRLSQFLAAFLLPFIFVVGMGVATVIFQATINILNAGNVNGVGSFFLVQTIMGTGIFILLIWASFKWVSTAGFGLLDLSR